MSYVNIKTLITLKKQLQSKKIMLLDFHAIWCVQCKLMDIIVDELSSNNKKLEILKIDVSHDEIMQKEFKIMGLPTILLYKNGVEVKRFNGLCDLDTLQEGVDKLK